jgi:hypothetical protein
MNPKWVFNGMVYYWVDHIVPADEKVSVLLWLALISNKPGNIIWLVVSTPLKNMSSSVGMIISN